ncbi:3-deoxy-D-manno-oct-2-ulosonate III transferase WaaZ [Citrobacter sp. FP75]|uniref:3-deoxy-D-manno-oct-2-ulosonate III transferase WaaZ n=1 Tax=Citrobacter sp. FP75 TaxID=1852949 RepID=UPI001BCA5CA4|nr:3-deoxy-D-manno-oct-2-ulosonate III transferase WaaZ [Citrobacter sp. FP75]
MIITKQKIDEMKKNISNDCIIYLSGPSSLETPIDLMNEKCVFSVNGSAGYLIDNHIPIFAYIVCDGSFYRNCKDLFNKYSSYATYTFISENILEQVHGEEKETLINNFFILRDFCKSRGGLGRKIRYAIKSTFNSSIFIKCSVYRKVKTIAFSTDVSYGHFGSATVAFSALQIAISFNFKRIIFSGLDLNNKCERFYNEARIQPTTLPSDLKFILKSLSFLKEKYHGEIYNLSKKTAIPYDIIPFISADEIS